MNNKGKQQSVHPASLMGAFVICSLGSIIAKQQNLLHSKLQASIEQADFSKMWLEILKKRKAANIEPGLENITRPLVFTSTSGCRASENFDIFSENYFYSYVCQNFSSCRAGANFKIFRGL